MLNRKATKACRTRRSIREHLLMANVQRKLSLTEGGLNKLFGVEVHGNIAAVG